MDKKQFKKLGVYLDRALSQYRKSDRDGRVLYRFETKINQDILEQIALKAKEQDMDMDDWVLTQIMNGLNCENLDDRPIKQKIDRPGIYQWKEK